MRMKAKTAFTLYRSHQETDENMFAGSREDDLRKVGGEWAESGRWPSES